LLGHKKKRLRGCLIADFHCEKEGYREKAGPESIDKRQRPQVTAQGIQLDTRQNMFRVVKSWLATLPLEIFKICLGHVPEQPALISKLVLL